jgi:hypothetical protein
MANLEITNCDTGNVAIHNEICRDELLAATGAKTYLKGTILARRAVATAVVAAPVGGNVGNGTVTLATVVAGTAVPVAGAYVLKTTAAVTNGGVFSLANPSGVVIATGLTMTPGAGAATVFKVGGLQFTVTDGSTDFSVNDSFTLTVAADGKVVPFDKAGAGGVQNPYAVLQYQVVAPGAGNIPCRPIVAGEVNRTRLIIDADGTGVNVDDLVVANLRERSIIATDVAQLARLDNQ